MAKSEVWRDPKAVALWVMTAVVLFLIIPAGAATAIWCWVKANPGVPYNPNSLVPPQFLLPGILGLAVGVILVLLVCWKLQLGWLWLALAVVVLGPLLWLASWMHGQAPTVVAVLLSPVIGALVFKPGSPKDRPAKRR